MAVTCMGCLRRRRRRRLQPQPTHTKRNRQTNHHNAPSFSQDYPHSKSPIKNRDLSNDPPTSSAPPTPRIPPTSEHLTRHLHRRPRPHARAREKHIRHARIPTQIKVHLGAVLIRHVADGVAVDGTEVVDFDFDRLGRHDVIATVVGDGEGVALPAGGARAGAGADAELFLRDRGGVAA